MSEPEPQQCVADTCAASVARLYIDATGSTVGLCRLHRQMVLFNMTFTVNGKSVVLVHSREALMA